MTDARFEDGGDKPLRLQAFDAEDLAVLSALVQDAIFQGTELRWIAAERRFALLINRFRWEGTVQAGAQDRAAERVRAMLVIDEVTRVRSQGMRKGEDVVLSLLSVAFEDKGEGRGEVLLTLAGDGAIALEVDALEVQLRDVTRPYTAPSGKVPSHEP